MSGTARYSRPLDLVPAQLPRREFVQDLFYSVGRATACQNCVAAAVCQPNSAAALPADPAAAERNLLAAEAAKLAGSQAVLGAAAAGIVLLEVHSPAVRYRTGVR